MSNIQDILISNKLVSSQEISKANFHHPDSGVLEALRHLMDVKEFARLEQEVARISGAPILEARHLSIDDAMSRYEISKLVARFRAVPIKWLTDGNQKEIMLAMADPFEDEAVKVFSQVFSLPVKRFLARESDILSTWLKFKARFAIEDNPVAQTHEVSAENYQREQERIGLSALQQIIATAVKHSAKKVEIALLDEHTRATFDLSDGHSSNVELDVSPEFIVQALYKRGQLIKSSQHSLSGVARVGFKELSTDCKFSFAKKNSEHAARLSLSEFAIDYPENPLFWSGIVERDRKLLNEILEPENGLIIISGSRSEDVRFALKSLRDTLGEVQVAEVQDLKKNLSAIIRRASGHRMLVGMESKDIFPILALLQTLLPDEKELLRGVVGYTRLPRICWHCRESEVPSDISLSIIPKYIDFSGAQFKRGFGCSICAGKGEIGWISACSAVNLCGRIRHGFLSDIPFKGLMQELVANDYVSLFEAAFERVFKGEMKLEHLVKVVPRPHSDYEELRKLFVSETKAKAQRSLVLGLELYQDEVQPIEVDGDLDFSLSSGNGGSNFVPEKPMRGAEAFAGKKRQSESIDANAVGKHLIVIDDDPDQRDTLQRILELEGYKVTTAADGIDGLVAASKEKPDLIIIDFMMPELNGCETIKRLKKNPEIKDIPIVVLTAHSDPEIEYSLLEVGADEFLSKSTAKKILLKRISRLL